VRALREQVQHLLDRQEIVACLNRYARGLDRHDAELLASVFHPDGIDHHGDFIGSRDEFVPWANALHEESWSAHTHFMAGHQLEIEGDVAHAETYVLVVLRRKDGSKVDLGGGRYIDRLERRDGEWRIAARELVLEWRAEADVETSGRALAYPHGTWDRSDPSYRRPFELQVPLDSGAAG
jgi:SnoaL-like protein